MKQRLYLGYVVLGYICFNTKVVECITCLNCQNIADLSQCKDVLVCKEDEACYIDKVLSPSTFQPIYNTGCKNMEYCKLDFCNKKAYGDGNSRRKKATDGEGLTLCSHCCYDDSCNAEGCGYKHPLNNNTKCFSCKEVYEGGPPCIDTEDCDLKLFACSVTNHLGSTHPGAYELGCKFKRKQCDLYVSLEANQKDKNVKCCDTTLCNASPYNRKVNKTAIAIDFECPTGIARPTTTPAPTTDPPKTTTTTRPPLPAGTPAPFPTKPSTLTPPHPPTKPSKNTTTIGLPTKPPTKPTTTQNPTVTTAQVTNTTTTVKNIKTTPVTNATTTQATSATSAKATDVTTIQPTNATSVKTTNATKTLQSTSITPSQVTNVTTLQTTTATSVQPTNATSANVTKSTTPSPTSVQVTNATTVLLTTQSTTKSTTTQPTTKATTPSTTLAASTGPPPKTLPPITTSCAKCAGPGFLCEKLYAPTPCPPPNNYCINTITNHKDGTKTVDRACGNFDTCYREWFLGSSDNDKCRKFRGNDEQRLDFQCTFCCVKDNCNIPLHPADDSLYKPV